MSSVYSIILDFDMKKFRTGLQNADRKTKGLQKSFNSLRNQIGLAFGTYEIARFTKQALDLGAQVQSADRAFRRFAGADTMNQLKEATAGTVSELELMQQANQAKNYRIPMEVLAEGLKFARIRARETGQSVDELVRKFTMGLGRESKLIIDDLGISQKELNEELDKGVDFTTAVLNVMRRQGQEAGEYVETAADSADRLAANWENLLATVGQSTVWKNMLDILNDVVLAFKYFNDYGYIEADWEGVTVGLPSKADIESANRAAQESAMRHKGYLEEGRITLEELKNFIEEQQELYNSMDRGTSKMRLDFQLKALRGVYSEITTAAKEAEEAQQEAIRVAAQRAQDRSLVGTSRMGMAGTPEIAAPELPRLRGLGMEFTQEFIQANNEMQRLQQNAEKVSEVFSYYPQLQQLISQGFEAALISGEDFFKTMEKLAINLVKQLVVQVTTLAALSAIASALTGGVSFGAAFAQGFSNAGGFQGLLFRGGDMYSGLNSGARNNQRTR